MSIEALQKVTETERSSRDRKAEAAAEAKRLVAEAERLGRQAVVQARAEAEEQVKAMLAQAEARAGETAKAEKEVNAQACETLKSNARLHLERAADLIVEKVGNG